MGIDRLVEREILKRRTFTVFTDDGRQPLPKINAILDKKTIKNLTVGEQILISGEIFTARDAAHKRFSCNCGDRCEWKFTL